MKKLLYICCIIGLSACNSNKQEKSQDFAPTPTGLQGIQAPASSTSTPVSNSQASSNPGALNPAHGQPGHRCEIAVGAPLSSAPAQNVSQQAVTTQPTSVTQQAVQAPAQTQTATPTVNEKGQKLNPAHGMPGHSCEIAVGAPLN